MTNTRFVELVVDGRAAAAGRAVRDAVWPSRTVVVGLQRDGEALEPRGDTVLRAGDEVVVLTSVEATEDVRTLLGVPAEPPGSTPASRD
ncbi:MAG: hypothetical protein KY434_08590 [Actinobacteria bacterium]|nr:hypothetical protein [Actinomycetota bacterium]